MPRLLYFSGSMGLGHVTRDMAIVREIRRLRSDVAIDWIATSPAREYLAERGERVLEESDLWGDPTGQAEAIASAGRGLNLTTWVLGLRNSWAKTGRLSIELMESGGYDVAVADEAYDLAIALAGGSSPSPCPCFLLFDFLGMDAMTWNPVERLAAAVMNRTWSTDPKGRYRPVFLGELDDIPTRGFGPFRPDRRTWAERHALVVGHVLTFDPEQYRDRAAVRERLGYGPQPLLIASAGGTNVGGDLLRLCIEAFPYARRSIPDLQMVAVAGPRVVHPEASLPEGVEIRGFVPMLHEHFAACDLAVVQGGGTSLLELTALDRPFIYLPLTKHFEQMIAVTWRQERLGAGVRLLQDETSPERLGSLIAAELGRDVHYPPLNVGGAQRLAEIVCDSL